MFLVILKRGFHLVSWNKLLRVKDTNVGCLQKGLFVTVISKSARKHPQHVYYDRLNTLHW